MLVGRVPTVPEFEDASETRAATALSKTMTAFMPRIKSRNFKPSAQPMTTKSSFQGE